MSPRSHCVAKDSEWIIFLSLDSTLHIPLDTPKAVANLYATTTIKPYTQHKSPCESSFCIVSGPVLTYYRVVFALFVINKAGGLVYNREFHTGMSKLSSNDYLTLAGSFHGYTP